jgi:hypothetical protein
MTGINLHNYEAWFLDFYDGTLNAVQCQELFFFLEKNPKLKSEFENFELVILSPEPTNFDEKSILKIEDDSFVDDPTLRLKADDKIRYEAKTALKKPSVSEEQIIELAEGALLGADAKALMQLIDQDKALKSTFNAYRLTKLKADSQIVFPNKAALRKEATIVPLFIRYASIAAVFGGILFAAWWFNRENKIPMVAEIPIVQRPNQVIVKSDFQENDISAATPAKEAKAELKTTNEKAKSENTLIPVSTPKVSKKVVAKENNKQTDLANTPTLPIQPETTVPEISVPVIIETPKPNVQESIADNYPIVSPPITHQAKPDNLPSQKEITSIPLSKGLGHFARAAAEKISNATNKHVSIERGSVGDDEYHTSTFKLGALEVHRSRSAK